MAVAACLWWSPTSGQAVQLANAQQPARNSGSTGGSDVSSHRPNVLFLAVDDMRPAIGAYGDSLAHTPNIDRLAARGLLFERAYCQQALCAPSRASIITGRRPEAFPKISGGLGNAGSHHYREELPDVVTLPQLFKQQRWFAESIGKVNHVYPPILDPVSWSVPERMADIVKRDEYLRPENRVRGFIEPMTKGEASERIEAPDSAYVDGQAADLAIEELGRLKDKPFFLAVGTKRPHLPWSAPERYWRMYERESFSLPEASEGSFSKADFLAHPWRYEWAPQRGEMRAYTDIGAEELSREKTLELRHGYYAAVSYIDAQIGRILDALDRLDLARRTIIVFWADHGYHIGENGQWGKKTNTELDLRVPLIVVAPGYTRPGSRTSALVELVDMYPTLAELAGLPIDPELEGTSFVPVLANPTVPWKEAVFHQYVRDRVHGAGVRTSTHRYVEWTDQQTGKVVDRELYNLREDLLERTNLAEREPQRAAEMSAVLKRGWRAARPAAITQRLP